MGLFRKKAKKEPKAKPNGAAQVAETVFDEQYREQLRQMGKRHFRKIIEENSVDLDDDIKAILAQTSAYLKDHMARQLDIVVTRVQSDISNQLNDRMNEFNRVAGESQELVIQSLSRNAQIVHEKYQQMSSNLQQIIASQEVMMATVFQDSKAQVVAVQGEQDRALDDLKKSMERVRQQSEEAVQQLRQQSDEQSRMLDEIYQQTSGGASQMKQSQEQAISSLEQSVASLQEQHGRLQQMMDESIAKQKTMATELINEHMARIIEHYLIGALGERSDLAKDLPNILEKMQEHKQAMMDDMSL